ncbi:hypothetical protein BGP78_10920 [Pseudoalteromonas sp. MSK9-3]|uniref:type II secretion system protein n=1 Tax=Pseudoalteromonas sp. MSK9-3 TaxID=1897633 RepID=UPI000E6C55B0|nr:type II secretion system protein [Pseudoalteromonas sp. MSK9-3]RJE76907.1 hypothetical protein BGP78_10920 [Pseudoalteromonas sp. MSK9-3]
MMLVFDIYDISEQRGYTLIELLVVLTIVGLLMGIVAPLSIHGVKKAEAKVEFQQTENWLVGIANEAFLKGENYNIMFEGRSAFVFHKENVIKEKKFSYLTFPKQGLTVNHFGIPSLNTVSVQNGSKVLKLSLLQSYE